MARLTQPFISVSVSSSAQEMYRSTRHSSEFIHNAFMPFGYPKRAFNSFPLRDHSNLMVIDGVGKWSGHFLVYRFSWRSEHIKYLPFRPSYKKKKQEVISPVHKPF